MERTRSLSSSRAAASSVSDSFQICGSGRMPGLQQRRVLREKVQGRRGRQLSQVRVQNSRSTDRYVYKSRFATLAGRVVSNRSNRWATKRSLPPRRFARFRDERFEHARFANDHSDRASRLHEDSSRVESFEFRGFERARTAAG